MSLWWIFSCNTQSCSLLWLQQRFCYKCIITECFKWMLGPVLKWRATQLWACFLQIDGMIVGYIISAWPNWQSRSGHAECVMVIPLRKWRPRLSQSSEVEGLLLLKKLTLFIQQIVSSREFLDRFYEELKGWLSFVGQVHDQRFNDLGAFGIDVHRRQVQHCDTYVRWASYITERTRPVTIPFLFL